MDDKLILKILSDHLHGRKTVLPDGVSLQLLSEQARIHQVDGIVYKQCAPLSVPSLVEAYSATVFYHENRAAAVADISKALSGAGIPFCTVKGLNIAKFYPVPALRTMGDCDIVVPPERMQDAVTLMRTLGFTGDIGLNGDWSGDRDGLHFELHDRLATENAYTSKEQADFFNGFMNYVTENELDLNFHFLFLLYHIKKHLRDKGAGIRHFFDLAVVIRNSGGLDAAWIDEKLKFLQMKKFADNCFSLVEDWFEVTAPVPFERADAELKNYLTKHILRNGVFGFAYDTNKDNVARDALVGKRGPVIFRRAAVILRDFFPPYKSMSTYKGTEYVKGRPLHLPVAWLHRLVLLLRRKDKTKSRNTLRRVFLPKAELRARKEYLEKLGIDK